MNQCTYCTFTTIFIRTHRTFLKSIPRVPVPLILGPCIRLYIFIAAARSMEASGYPLLSNLGTAVHSLPSLKDISLINPVHKSLSSYLITTCVVVCCGLGLSRPEQPFVTLLSSATTLVLLIYLRPNRSATFCRWMYDGTLVPEYMLVSPAVISISHAVFSISAVVSRRE